MGTKVSGNQPQKRCNFNVNYPSNYTAAENKQWNNAPNEHSDASTGK